MNLVNSLSRRAALGLLLLATTVQAADVAGDWTWTSPGRNGGPDRVSTLTLKVDGGKLSGKISSPGREGAAVETPITEAKLDGDAISFNVVREFNGNSMTAKYNGKVSADKITGKIETSRDGQARSRDWEAKRVVAAAKP